MLHADANGLDILDVAEREHAHAVGMAASDEYRWMADHMYDDADRARTLRDIAEDMSTLRPGYGEAPGASCRPQSEPPGILMTTQ
jgi:hypothetical protein